MRKILMMLGMTLLGSVLASCSPRGPEVVEIRGERDGLTRWLRDRADDCFSLLAMTAPGHAHYTQSGASACGSVLGLAPGDGDFVVGTVLTAYDEHDVRNCTVTAITAAGVRIDCVERFDLRAFGQNRIQITHAGVVLTYRQQLQHGARDAAAPQH